MTSFSQHLERRRRQSRLPICVALLLLVSLPCLHAKFVTGTVQLGGPRDEFKWRYVSKFGYGTGTGTWSMRIKTIRPHLNTDTGLTFPIDIYLDNDWDAVDAAPNCESSPEADTATTKRGLRKTTRDIVIPANGEWSEWVEGTLSQSIRPHVWYFGISDCDAQLKVSHRLRFEFKANQPDGSEFTVDHIGYLGLLILEFVAFTAFIVYYVRECRKFIKSADTLHPVLWVLSTVIGLQYLANVFTFLHYWAYSGNGYGIKALDVISEIVSVISQIMAISLLILIGLGYTLLHSGLGNLDVVVPIVFIVGVVHVLFVGFGKIKDDAAYKFHEHEGVVGWLMVVSRLALFAWFLWGVGETFKEASPKMRFFLRKFGAASALYFLAWPVLFVLCCFIAPYWRHMVISVGNFLCRFAAFGGFTSMFLTRGEYFKVSTLNASILPGGIKTGIDKEE